MKNTALPRFLAFFLLAACASLTSSAQTKKPAPAPATVKPAATKTAPAQPKFKFCTVPDDSSNSAKLMLSQLMEWANDLPLKVMCDQKNRFQLKQFEFTIITMSPLQTREFGLANNGIPILGRKAIDQMKQGDSVFLKNAIGTDKDGNELSLPNMVISLIDPPAATLELQSPQE